MLIVEGRSPLSKKPVGRLIASGTHPSGLFAALHVALGRKEDRFFALLGIPSTALPSVHKMKKLVAM
jgi:hypothetical protein